MMALAAFWIRPRSPSLDGPSSSKDWGGGVRGGRCRQTSSSLNKVIKAETDDKRMKGWNIWLPPAETTEGANEGADGGGGGGSRQ